MTHNQHLNYRPDIDGLRAVAVLLVLIFHGFPRFIKGGFIGVDIFFVISGYLITSIILKSQARGDFSLIEFYSRRIKRIFPSLLVVLLFCLTVGWFSLLADEYQALGKHVAAGALYISNFVLKNEAGYFDIDAEFKPLLHLWSLGIEEQFYLVFPLLLILIARFKGNAFTLIFLSLVSSFGLNVLLIEQHPTDVFFFPHTRVWELLIGSFIAHVNLYQRERFDALLTRLHLSFNALSWLGVVLIAGAWIGLDSTKITFPNGWALFPTLGAAGLILAGEEAWFNRHVLASKSAVWLGVISYPLYLWHWSLLSLMRIIEMDRPKGYLRVLALLLSVLLAWLTYQFVEKRLRFWNHKGVTIGLFVSLLFVGLIGFQIQKEFGYPNRFDFVQNWDEGELGHDEWRKKWSPQKECLDKWGKKLSFCTIKDNEKSPTVMLIGDSHADHLYPALLQFKPFQDDNILNLAGGGCAPFFDLPKENCRTLMNEILNKVITTSSVHTVVLSNREILNLKSLDTLKLGYKLNNLFSKSVTASDNSVIFQKSMRVTFQKLLRANKRVIYVIDIPELGFSPETCAIRPWKISNEITKSPCTVQRDGIENHKIYRELIKSVLNEFPQVTIWDTTGAFCDETYCFAIKEKKMLYRDDNHLSEIGSLYLGNYLNEKYSLGN
jgi:peptidoglycan/LPS O-acetylase OafA/YrhL